MSLPCRWFRVALALCLIPVAAHAADKPLTVLFLHGSVTTRPPGQDNVFVKRSYLPDVKLQEKLAAEGIVWGAESFSTQMTWDFLKQFNVVVMLDFPIIESHQDLLPGIRQTEALLKRFVAEGGGLMLTGNTEYGMWALERDFDEMNRFLDGTGAQVLHEQVDESDATLTLTTMGISALAYTGNVTKSPLTEGVRGLLYPTDHLWSYWTHPLKVDPSWQVLVKGSPSSFSFTRQLGGATHTGDLPKTPGTYKSEPPLVAVKDGVGRDILDQPKGRLCLWPIVPSAFIIDGYHPFWGDGMIMEGTRADKPSDARKLLANLVRWLGAPSAATFGGYQPPPDPGFGNEPGMQVVDWDSVKVEGKSQPNCWRGLIGMHSNLSDGTAAPADMIAAAKAAGYHFAAFTDELDKLTAEKLEAMKSVCLAKSDASFQVYPGFTYRDESGNRWVTFGRQMKWPQDDWWSKRVKGAIEINNLIFRGLQYPPVIMLPGDAEPAWLQGNFKGIAVQQYRAGKLQRDSLDVYQSLQRDGFDLFPVVVDEVRSADDIKAAAGAPMQSYVRWWELDDVINGISGNVALYKGNYVFHRPGFISGGPVIEDFRIYNFGSADLALAQNDRYRLHFDLSSDKGLKEVALYDGAQLMRRVALSGEKAWVGEFEGYQDREHHFLAIVTDVTGGRAISADRWTSIQDVAMVRCTDNLNTYTSGKSKAVKYFAPRGLESYIDQQAGAFGVFPYLANADTERPAIHQHLTADSRFGYIKDDVFDHHYAETASANWNRTDVPEVAQPQTVITGKTRTTMWANRPEGTACYVVEGDYTSLADTDIPRPEIAIYACNWLAEADTVFVARRGQPAWGAKMATRQSWYSGSLDDVEYVAQLGALGGARAIIPLQSGMTWITMQNQGRNYLGARLPVPDKKLTKGQAIKYRYLAVWDTVGGKPDTVFVEDVVAKLGLRGQTAYTVKPERGKVLDTRFTLSLQADGGGFSGVITKAGLPIDLPVTVTNLNDRWPAGILYRGKNDLLIPVWKMDKVSNRWSEREQRTIENELRRFSVQDGVGMLQVDTELGDRNVYIGSLLVCDQPEVFLELEDARPGKQIIMANNPTDKPLTVTIKPGPDFDLLPTFSKTLTLKPGEVARFAPQ